MQPRVSPLDAAIAEDKLIFAMGDTPARASLLALAKWCLEFEPSDRPDMIAVAACLHGLLLMGPLESEVAMRTRYGAPLAVPPATLVSYYHRGVPKFWIH